MTVSTVWKPSPQGLCKLNFDAAVFSELKSFGVGAIIRNANGDVMAGMAAKGPPVSCSEEAELLANRKAIKFAMDAGFSEFMLEGDNVTVIKAISSLSTNDSMMGNIVADIQHHIRSLNVVSISRVKKDGNRVAHSLAQYARNTVDDLYWLEDSPPPALEALYHDALHINA